MALRIKPQKPNYKNIFESLEVIESLHKNHYVIINKEGSPFDKAVADFVKDKNKGFSLKFDDPSYRLGLGDIDGVKITTTKYSLDLDKVFVNSISVPQVSGRVSSFITQGFNKKEIYYYRLVIPLKAKVDFYFYIEQIGYRTRDHSSSECLRVNYKGLDIDLYKYIDKETDSNYLILDALNELTLEEFQDYCFSTLVSLGYITGNLPQDEGYFLAFNKSDMKVPTHICYSELRGSLNSLYSPIYRNPHGYIRDSKLAQSIYPTLRTLTLGEFSKLCRWTHNSIEFSSILLLVIEACTASLLVMPSGLAIALEGLTELIVKDNEDKLFPINDKLLAKKIRIELLKIVDRNAHKLNKEGIQILKSKIDNINQLTNANKLTKPFELLHFNLTDEDRNAIDHRNDFLHGRISFSSASDIKKANTEIYYIALRLYTLVAVLILKSIGYDNKILNYPKLYEKTLNKALSEEHYRQV